MIEPAIHGDARGYFMEAYTKKDIKEAGFNVHFVQDNQSMSTKGVLHSLHFYNEYPQCKLVRGVRDTVFDVAVDLRANIETYGKRMVLPYPLRTRNCSLLWKALHTASRF